MLVADSRAVEEQGKLRRARYKMPRIGLLRRAKGDNMVAMAPENWIEI